MNQLEETKNGAKKVIKMTVITSVIRGLIVRVAIPIAMLYVSLIGQPDHALYQIHDADQYLLCYGGLVIQR